LVGACLNRGLLAADRIGVSGTLAIGCRNTYYLKMTGCPLAVRLTAGFKTLVRQVTRMDTALVLAVFFGPLLKKRQSFLAAHLAGHAAIGLQRLRRR